MDIDYWNRKIYRDDVGNFVEGGLKAQQFWDEFKIESGPLFKDQCYSHIPEKWADDVRLFIKQVQSELGSRIIFKQIKEKWCWLTVYYGVTDIEADNRLKELERECMDRLIQKGIHPARE